MNVRPHHLLCIQKFTGHGYHADFTAHMKSVVSALKEHPETSVTIVQGCDDLCKMCPNQIGGVCISHQKTALMDSAVLRICNFAYGERVLWKTAADTARERILETAAFDTVCAACQWYALCRRTEVHCECHKRNEEKVQND